MRALARGGRLGCCDSRCPGVGKAGGPPAAAAENSSYSWAVTYNRNRQPITPHSVKVAVLIRLCSPLLLLARKAAVHRPPLLLCALIV